MNVAPCTVCNEGGHVASRCPCLCEPLKGGFHSGGNGGGGHGGDEEDDAQVKVDATVGPPPSTQYFIYDERNDRVRNL